MRSPHAFQARRTRTVGARAALLSALLVASACPHERVDLFRSRDLDDDGDGRRPYDEVCGGESVEAFGPNLELLVLLDNSLTMGFTPVWGSNCPTLILDTTCPQTAVGLTPTLWQAVIPELKNFVNDPRSDGLAVALKYFGRTCEPPDYRTADVPMGTLPDRAEAIERSLDDSEPNAETTTRPALEGMLEFMRQRAERYGAHPVIVLITDAANDGPDDCTDNSTASVSRVIASGDAGDPPVSTYVFSLLPNPEFDESARAAGTHLSRFTDLSVSGALVDAFHQVRELELAELRCEYELPRQYARDVNDPNLVNLTHDDVPIRRVAAPADCDEAGGWHYDDPSTPSRIIACPSSCERLKSGGSVDVVLKCPTVERAL